ncbi:hypothetical protein [Sinomicrobium sp. M5D2P9]
MNFIQQYPGKCNYYLPDNKDSNTGFLALILPESVKDPEPTISLEEALSQQKYAGSFVFSARTPDISDEKEAGNFIKDIYNNIIKNDRGIVWLTNPVKISPDTASLLGLSANGSVVNSGLQAPLVDPELTFIIGNGMPVSLPPGSTTLKFGTTTSSPVFSFGGPAAPAITQSTQGTLDFAGAKTGCVTFQTYITRQSLYDDLKWGFQFLFPHPAEDHTKLSEWLPIASGGLPSGSDRIKFTICIDSSDPFNKVFTGSTVAEKYASRRTYFDFEGKNFDRSGTELVSYYKTIYGNTLNLIPLVSSKNGILPARMVLSPGEETSTSLQNFHLAPEGDYLLQNGSIPDGSQVNLICGLQGTEFFTITTADPSGVGDKIRFLSNSPAFSDKFPFEPVSPVAAPPVLDASIMNDMYTTSWATILRGGDQQVMYVAQPKGSALFGTDSIQGKDAPVYGHTTPGFEFDTGKDIFFPMAPYSGISPGDGSNGFSAGQTEQYESQILSGIRRNLVAKASGKTVKNAMFTNKDREAEASQITTSTPSGLIAKLSGTENDYTWDEVLLGQNKIDGEEFSMYFPLQNDQNETNEALLQALQTSDLFLVVANDANLQGFGSGTTSLNPPPPNYMQIEDWGIQVNAGSKKSITYNDYSNVMIIKGRKGPLYTPGNDKKGSEHKDPDGLVMNSDKWTNANTFACPQGPDKNTDELIILSQWIQNYFEKAARQSDNPYFKKFNSIATDPDWTGILFLRADLRKLPANLTGIMAGVRYPQNFNAHHFAIDISPVKPGDNGPVIEESSSIFGLIYYEDPYFKGVGENNKVEPVTPSNNNNYDFCLLTLKVRFENTSVKSFESYAQLTLNQLYGSRITGMGTLGNSLNTIVLKGSLQITNGRAVYAMGTDSNSSFYPDNNILRKVEINNVLLSTQDDGTVSGKIDTSFDLSGYLDYAVVSDPDQGTFDIFSFGNEDGQDKSLQGLRYSNLAIPMSFTKEAQEQAEMANRQVQAGYTFDSTEITFDIARSTARKESLFLSLALDVQSFIIGKAEIDPKKMGYLQVLSNIRMAGVAGETWYGLRFRVNMGTPGELAGKVNLTSYLVTAWSPASTGDAYKAQLGMMLPGTGGGARLISLQSVMSLSIGQIKLVYNKDQKAFLLMMTEIALKFLGLLKIPPSGSTLFYLFGNPQGTGKPSGLGWYAQYTNVPEKGRSGKALTRLN